MNSESRATLGLVVCSVILTLAAPQQGWATCYPCDTRWNSPLSGDWFDPGNWTEGVPGPTDIACVDYYSSTPYTVHLDSASATVAGLCVENAPTGSGESTLAISNGTFNLDGPGIIGTHGRLQLSNANMVNSQTTDHLAVHGAIDLDDGIVGMRLDLIGALTWTGVSSISSPEDDFTTQVGCTMSTGSETAPAAELTVANGFTNHCDLRFTWGGSRRLQVSNGTLVNAFGAVIRGETITGKSGLDEPPATIEAEVANQGVIQAQSVSLAITSPRPEGVAHVNEGGGDIQALGAEVYLDLTDPGKGGAKAPSSFTNHGNVLIGVTKQAATMTIEGGTFYPSDGTIAGNGTLHLEQTTVNAVPTGVTLVNPSYQLILSGTVVAPTVTIDNNSETLAWGTNTVQGPFHNGGTLRVQANPDHGDAQLVYQAGTLDNYGTVELDNADTSPLAASLVVTAGSFHNQSSGFLSAVQGGGGPRFLNAELVNDGHVTAEAGATLTVRGGGLAHVNSDEAEVSVYGGMIRFDLTGVTKAPSSFTNHGNVLIETLKMRSSVVEIQGGTFFMGPGGTVEGNGTLYLQETTVDAESSAVVLSNPTYELILSDTTVTSLVGVESRSETLVWGSTACFGPLTNYGSAALRVQATPDRGNAQLAYHAGDLPNDGLIELTNVATAPLGAALVVTAGGLVNLPAGEILALPGGGGPRVITAEISSQGTVRASNTALTVNGSGLAHVNSGLVHADHGEILLDLTGVAKAPSSFTNHGNVLIGVTKQGDGLVRIVGGTFCPADGTVTGNGELELVDTTVECPTGGTLANDTTELRLIGTTVAPGATVVNSSLTRAWGLCSIQGALLNNPGATLVVEGTSDFGSAILGFSTSFTNEGAIELRNADSSTPQGATLTVGGTLTNLATGSVTTLAGTGGGSRYIFATLDNQGLVRTLDSDLVISVSGPVAHTSSGVLELVGGKLQIGLSAGGWTFTNHGQVDLGEGNTLQAIGGTLVNASDGELVGQGTVNVSMASLTNSGLIAPGSSPGQLTVVGDLHQTSSAVIRTEICDPSPGIGHDWLEVTGLLERAGTLDILPFDEECPIVPGNVYVILTYASNAGAFDTVALAPLPHSLTWSFEATGTEGIVTVSCAGPDLALTLAADKDPVTVNHVLTYTASVTNLQPVEADDVVVRDTLPATLTFEPAGSSPECNLVGGDVECVIGTVDPSGTAQVVIAVRPIAPGDVLNTATVELDECDVSGDNNTADLTVRVTSAEPCDADDDGYVTEDDVPVAAAHLFGTEAPGNPDCAEGDGVNAADVASTIVGATVTPVR